MKTPASKPAGSRLAWVLLLCLTSVATASASVTGSLGKMSKPVTGIPVNTVGYRTPWQEHMRGRALKASRDNEPYLANQYWRLLAEAGDRDAAFRLGLFFDTQRDSQADARRAVYWYRQAAQAGEMHAQHNLGVAYATGKGVALDMQQAIKWWTRAARQGNAGSQYNLGIMYTEGEYGVKRNLELAKHWWRLAAWHGDAMAQYNLGRLYMNGRNHDYCEAMHWWHEAARRGVEQARLALRAIKTRSDYDGCH